MRVALSRDATAPLVVTSTNNRTGFAHLFENLMFEGSKNLPKRGFDKLIEGNGGLSNSIRFHKLLRSGAIPISSKPCCGASGWRTSAPIDENPKNQQRVVGTEVEAMS